MGQMALGGMSPTMFEDEKAVVVAEKPKASAMLKEPKTILRLPLPGVNITRSVVVSYLATQELGSADDTAVKRSLTLYHEEV